MSNLSYRPEVDGLRAIAILSVMIFHLNPSWLPGGFLGVDIFFVISGFLITKIITNEIEQGIFSFAHFYNRRIKRIYPVFILVLAIASIFSLLFFTRHYAENLRKTIELAVVFFSNIYLSHKQGYFDLSVNQNPIVHIWSLAVEEQYYIFFPILLVFAYKKLRQRKAFLITVITLFCLFLATTFIPQDIYTKKQLYTPYYLSHLRFPELLLGSFLALLPNSAVKVEKSAVKNKLVSIIATLGLILCLVFYHHNLPYLPGITLLLPCIFTALIIYSTNTENLIKTLLASKPMVFIGKISYSLYLFHWLFIACTYYITNDKQISNIAILIIAALSLLFSTLSYYFLENPIRRSKLTFKKSFFYLYLIPSLVVVGFNLGTKSYISKRELLLKGKPEIIEQNPNIPVKILVIGDSHAEHLQYFMQYVGKQEGWKADFWSVNDEGCDFIVNTDNQPKVSEKCVALKEKIEQYPIIIYSFYYNLKTGDHPTPRPVGQDKPQKNFKIEFINTLKEVSKTKQVYVMADNISVTRTPASALILQEYGIDKFLTPIQEFGNTQESNDKLRDFLAQEVPKVKWIDAAKYLNGAIYADGKVLISDYDHLTDFGSQYMGIQFHKHERILTPEEVEELYKN